MTTTLAVDDPRIQAVLQRIRELSRNGIACGAGVYDARRRDTLSVSALRKYGWNWGDLVELAGVELSAKAARARLYATNNRFAARRAEAGVPPEVEAEIREAFARGDHLLNHKRAWPLLAIPTRKEHCGSSQTRRLQPPWAGTTTASCGSSRSNRLHLRRWNCYAIN